MMNIIKDVVWKIYYTLATLVLLACYTIMYFVALPESKRWEADTGIKVPNPIEITRIKDLNDLVSRYN
jgi:hypothetical protein